MDARALLTVHRDEEAAEPPYPLRDGCRRAMPERFERRRLVRLRQDPSEDDQQQRKPEGGVQHGEAEELRVRRAVVAPGGRPLHQVKAGHQERASEQEDDEREAELARQVADVRQQDPAGRNEREPDVPPAEDGPGREVGGQPGERHHEHDEGQVVVADAAREGCSEPVAHASLELLEARHRLRPRHDGQDLRQRRGRADNEREQMDEALRPAQSRQQRAHHQPEEGDWVERWHLVHPVRPVDGGDDGEQHDRQQREGEQVLPPEQATPAARLLWHLRRQYESARCRPGGEHLVPVRLPHARPPLAGVASATAPSASPRSSVRLTR